MNYTNGLDKERFLRHMFDEFPNVFDTVFSRELLENIIDYGSSNHVVTKNGLYYFLENIIPEAKPNDLIPYIDKRLLTDEVLSLVEEPSIKFSGGYYEWNVSVDGNTVYTFGDVFGETEINDIEALESFVDDMIAAMQEELHEDEKDVLNEKQVADLNAVMIDVWKNYLGLEDKAESINETLADAKARSEKANFADGLDNNKDAFEI